MRENIGLYKAKRKDNSDWVEGYYLFIKEQNKHYILTGKTRSYPIDLAHPHLTLKGFEWLEIDPETLCECTGLKDKNGKLIWENDIVKHCVGDRYVIVEFIDGKFSIEKYGYNLSASNNFEIIGNRFDNKELLGE